MTKLLQASRYLKHRENANGMCPGGTGTPGPSGNSEKRDAPRRGCQSVRVRQPLTVTRGLGSIQPIEGGRLIRPDGEGIGLIRHRLPAATRIKVRLVLKRVAGKVGGPGQTNAGSIPSRLQHAFTRRRVRRHRGCSRATQALRRRPADPHARVGKDALEPSKRSTGGAAPQLTCSVTPLARSPRRQEWAASLTTGHRGTQRKTKIPGSKTASTGSRQLGSPVVLWS